MMNHLAILNFILTAIGDICFGSGCFGLRTSDRKIFRGKLGTVCSRDRHGPIRLLPT